MNKKKALETAREYIFPRLLECLYDCSDSMHEAEALKNRFDAYVDDSISIDKFIKKNLKKEYIEILKDALAENGDSIDTEEGLESVKSPVCDLPIPYEEIKNLLK